MTAVGALAFPGSSTLAQWWRQLAPRQPRTLWVGHLLLHRIEALVRHARPTPLEPLHFLVLKALTVYSGETTARLRERLHLDGHVLGRILHGLAAEGLARAAPGWEPTDQGLQALKHGVFQRSVQERRGFHFLESEDPEVAPHFLPLADAAGAAWPAPPEWRFDVRLLQRCVQQPAEWKQRFGFPEDVQEIVTGQGPAEREPWRSVMLDRPEQLKVVLALTAAERGERLLGLAVQPEGWELRSEEPVFVLGEGWREVFPQLVVPLASGAWEQAWQKWCQRQGLTDAAQETVGVTMEGHRLRVTVSALLMEQLRGRGLAREEWLLAGEGRMRFAAALEVIVPPD